MKKIEKVNNYRYVTSKIGSIKDIQDGNLCHHGYRGEALASLREVCAIVQITSKAKENEDTNVALFIKSKRKDVEKATRDRQTHGTTVIITDFFYNFPVRRKGFNNVLEMDELKNILSAIALSHPEISLTLRNENNGEKLLQSYAKQTIEESFLNIYDTDLNSADLIKVNNSQENWKLKGFFAKKGFFNKSKQLIFVNNRFIRRSWMSAVISKAFQDSIIEKSESPRKQKNFPIFVLFFECPLKETDVTFEPRKTAIEFQQKEKVIKFIHETLRRTLKENNLLSMETCQVKSSNTIQI